MQLMPRSAASPATVAGPASVAGPALVAAALALLAGGCGGATRSHAASSHPHPAPVHHAAAAPSTDVAVIKGWSTALREGHLHAAAAYFALPSSFVNGGGGLVPVVRIHSLREAELVNASLPCGATFISAERRGPFVNALFRLVGRRGPGGGDCGSGAGQTARTNFVIRAGKILAWIRAPDDPGDNAGGGGAPTPTPTPGNRSAPVV